MMKALMKLPAAVAVAMGVAWVIGSAANADVLTRVDWNPRLSHKGDNDPFIGQTTDDTLASPGNLTQVGLTRNGGGNGSIPFANVPDTFDENYYISFSLIPAAGKRITVPDLFMQAGDSAARGIPADHLILRTSLDGFVADFGGSPGPTSLNGNTGKPVVFDLDSLPDITDELHFRLYAYDVYQDGFSIVGSIATRGYGLWFSDLNVTDVPEPASMALLATGTLLTLRRRKKLPSL